MCYYRNADISTKSQYEFHIIVYLLDAIFCDSRVALLCELWLRVDALSAGFPDLLFFLLPDTGLRAKAFNGLLTR